MEMNSNMPMMGMHHHKKFVGVLVALFGLDLLLGATDVFNAQTVTVIASILVICLGLKMMMKCNCSKCEGGKCDMK